MTDMNQQKLVDTVDALLQQGLDLERALKTQARVEAWQKVSPIQFGQLCRHVDGGIYRYAGMANHTEDQSSLVLYQHVWPFAPTVVPWARPVDQFLMKFSPMQEADLAEAMKQDQTQAQNAVRDAKAARRAAEQSEKA